MQKKQSNATTTQGVSVASEFTFGSLKVRTIKKNGAAWFVAQDVCNALCIKNGRDTVQKILDDDERQMSVVSTSGQRRSVWLVNESGMYNLAFRSTKPEARAFRKWVTSEVLPALRTQGSYEVQRADVESNRPAASKDLVNGMFALADNIGRVGNNYRRTALLREFKKIKKCLSL